MPDRRLLLENKEKDIREQYTEGKMPLPTGRPDMCRCLHLWIV